MKTDIPYLSDEELLKLIAETEEELVMAPPDLAPGVMRSIRASGKSPQEREQEFRRYCIRIMASMAAAIVLVFAMPSLLDAADHLHSEHTAQAFAEQEITNEKNSALFTEILGGHTFFSNGELFGGFFQKKGGSKT